MHKRKGIKTILACFMVMSILGMGFTGYKVQKINENSRAVYMNSIDVVDNGKEIVEEEANFIEVLESKVDIKLTAFTLTVGNRFIGNLKTAEEIASVLEEIKAPFSISEDENIQIKDVQILEKVDISEGEVYLEDIDSKEEVLDYIRKGGEELKTHTIEVGENFWTIGEIYGISMEELEKMNPDKDGNKLQVGDIVTIKTIKPLMTVVTTVEVNTIEKTDYEIEIKEDPNMYDTKKEIKVEGVGGENKVITKQIKHNGKIIEKQVISEEIIKEPIKQIVVKGTKKVPKTAPTGSFLMPTRGRISSPFGQRWGRMHRGIDIAKEHGSDIKAADGGTVSYSGVMGTYGNMIEVDHENGYKTRYAHCSRLLFSPGEKVYKGQVIAKIGSTGRSTGPHLHFEVIKNGVHQNPSNYVD